LHDETGDDLAVDLGEPGLAGFDRRHHPVALESVRPLLDAARLQPRGRLGKHVEHDITLVGPRRT